MVTTIIFLKGEQNMKDKTNIKLRKAMDGLKKNSPVILAGLAISGVIFTVFEAGKAGAEAARKLDKAKKEKGEELTFKEKVMTAGPCFIKTGIFAGATIGCMAGSTSKSIKQNVYVSAMYTAARKEADNISKKVEEICGKEVAEEVKEGVVDDRIEAERKRLDRSKLLRGRNRTWSYVDL